MTEAPPARVKTVVLPTENIDTDQIYPPVLTVTTQLGLGRCCSPISGSNPTSR
jgi:hypothetical protein